MDGIFDDTRWFYCLVSHFCIDIITLISMVINFLVTSLI